MRPFARSLPFLAVLGVACFQDSGPMGVSESASSGAATDTTGAASGATTGAPPTSTDATTGAPADCEVLYETDFSVDPAPDWTVFLPTWQWNSADGTFQGKAMDMGVGAGAQLTAGMWKDFTLRVRLRLGPTSYGGVVLRAADQFMGDFLYIQLDSTDGDLEGFRADAMNADFSFTGLVTANAWQELIVRFQGTDLSISYNGSQLANGLQIQGLSAGGLGLIVLKGSMDVDEIAVCPP